MTAEWWALEVGGRWRWVSGRLWRSAGGATGVSGRSASFRDHQEVVIEGCEAGPYFPLNSLLVWVWTEPPNSHNSVPYQSLVPNWSSCLNTSAPLINAIACGKQDQVTNFC